MYPLNHSPVFATCFGAMFSSSPTMALASKENLMDAKPHASNGATTEETARAPRGKNWRKSGVVDSPLESFLRGAVGSPLVNRVCGAVGSPHFLFVFFCTLRALAVSVQWFPCAPYGAHGLHRFEEGFRRRFSILRCVLAGGLWPGALDKTKKEKRNVCFHIFRALLTSSV